MNILDLHMHSNFSNDADYPPAALMEMCAAAGLKTVSIADHNTASAYPFAADKAKELGIKLIPAIELDCQVDGTHLHVVGYGIDPEYPLFKNFETDILQQERQVSEIRLIKIRELGIIIDEGIHNRAIDGVIIGELLGEFALSNPQNDTHPMLQTYRPGGRRSDNPYLNFNWDFCAKGCPAYVPVNYITINDAVSAIRDAGGFAVLAHPGANIGRNQNTFRKIINCGVEGVEVYNNYHDEKTADFYKALAEEMGIVITMGSDFHGKNKPNIKLGNFNIPEESEIEKNFLKKL